MDNVSDYKFRTYLRKCDDFDDKRHMMFTEILFYRIDQI